MAWGVFWTLVSVVGLAGLCVSVGSLRFARGVRSNVGRLFSAEPTAAALRLDRMNEMPVPVRTYLEKALGDAPRAVRSIRFRHGGRFRSKLDGPWQPIVGEQYDAAEPPGFVWWGRLKVGPGLWIDARDRCLNGKGNMLVSLESTVALFDRVGPEIDQGAMLRLLSDLVLLPAVLLDDRYVSWHAIDALRARATLRVGASEVTGIFQFGQDGLPSAFHSDRFLDSGQGEPRLLPWSGDYADYRKVEGLLVPHRFTGYWHVDGERIAYADFQLETPEYDIAQAF